jgi:hypothetical protein
MTPADVPIDVIARGDNTLILNTRSAQALTRAGIPRTEWTVVDRTGDPLSESFLDDQLARNGLDNTGFAEPWSFNQFGPDGPEGADVPAPGE